MRQGGILSPILFAVYMDPLITRLRHLGLGCSLHGEFFGSLFYADDILLMSHTIHAMQIMLHCCDKFADDFHIKFNSTKSVATRIGNRHGEKCAALQLAGKDILYISELKYLVIRVLAAKSLKFSIERLSII